MVYHSVRNCNGATRLRASTLMPRFGASPRFWQVGIIALVLLAVVPTTSSAERNCSDFQDHADAQSYFSGKGGTVSSNVDSLDGDHDGVACEALIRVGPVQRVRDFAGDGSVGTVSTVFLTLVLAGGIAFLWHRFHREATVRLAPNASLPIQDRDPLPHLPFAIPELRDVEATGMLVLTINTSDGHELPPGIRVALTQSSEPTVLHLPDDNPHHHVWGYTLPIGEYQVRISRVAPYSDQKAIAFVARDDVSRLTITLQRDPVSTG